MIWATTHLYLLQQREEQVCFSFKLNGLFIYSLLMTIEVSKNVKSQQGEA
jgi:hypothetical protein